MNAPGVHELAVHGKFRCLENTSMRVCCSPRKYIRGGKALPRRKESGGGVRGCSAQGIFLAEGTGWKTERVDMRQKWLIATGWILRPNFCEALTLMKVSSRTRGWRCWWLCEKGYLATSRPGASLSLLFGRWWDKDPPYVESLFTGSGSTKPCKLYLEMSGAGEEHRAVSVQVYMSRDVSHSSVPG